MKIKKIIADFTLLALIFTVSCGKTPQDAPTTSSGTTEPETTAALSPTEQLLAGMTTEHKIAQLLVAGLAGTEAGADGTSAVADYQVGGIILFGRNVSDSCQLTALTNQLKALNGDYIPLFLCVDEEGGRVSRMPPEITDIPCAYTYGNLSKPNLLTHLGSTLGAECAAFGLNLDFAPVMDVFSNPDNTVIGDRSYSSVPDTAAWAAALVAGGLRDTGIIAAGKHFPGHGDTVTDSHTELPVIDKTREEWNQTDAVPFREAVRSGIPVIMTGHILMSSLDSENPATLSHTIVTEILREEMGFDGVICTDDLTMGAISKTYGIGEAAVRAVAAGCDLLLICHESENLKAAYDALCAAVESGRISEERLNESVSRILSLKIEYKLTNDPIAIPDVDALNRQIKEILP